MTQCLDRRLPDLATVAAELAAWDTHEGDSIAISLVRAEAPRPLTVAFAARLLGAAGGHVQQLRINRLAEETFHAEVVLDSAMGTGTIDARPSDAIALALVAGAPIRVAHQR